MPLVEVTMLEGRSPEQVRALHEAMTTAVQNTLSVPREAVWVVVREVPPTNWAEGGVTLAEKRAQAARSKTA